jgi:lysophospholipase L1-like esterase
MTDVRVCCVGDSFVAGVGDPAALGWVGRLWGRSGPGVTVSNLGVRRDTSTDVRARWLAECTARFPAGCRPRVVLAFGVNDTTVEGGRPRTDPDVSVANLRHLLGAAGDRGWPVLVVGPPPIDDEEQNGRIAALDAAFGAACAERQVPYVPLFERLVTDPLWRREVREGDGAHPSAPGYELLAGLIGPGWAALLG